MKKFIVLLALISTSVSALTLKEKKQLADWQTGLDAVDSSEYYRGHFKTKCGYDMPLKLDEKFVTPFMEANTSAAAYCDAARSSMSSMCDDKMSKEAISKKIKSISCKLGKPEEASLKIAGSTLEFTVGLGAANLDQKVREFLENNL